MYRNFSAVSVSPISLSAASHKKKKSMHRLLGLLALLFLGVTSSKADPVIISGGVLVYDQTFGGHPFTLTGAGTVINGGTSSLSTVMGGSVPVLVGRQIQLFLLPLDSQNGEISATFPITVAGVTYSSGHTILLQLASNPVSFIVPAGGNGFVVTAPLTMTGGVFGFNSPLFEDQFFFHTLAGQGTQVFTFTSCFCNDPRGIYILESWTGTFGAVAPGVTVQSVPEPGSVLLLVTSVAALSWMRRRRV
jgi:hypothetical protein